jgi:hypothetical protein
LMRVDLDQVGGHPRSAYHARYVTPWRPIANRLPIGRRLTTCRHGPAAHEV